MKKLVAIVMLIGILASFAVPAYAQEGEKVNAMLNASIGIEGILKTQSKHVVTNMWDGLRSYNGDVSATYCDFKWASSAADATAENVMKYNIYLEDGKEDSIYYHVFEVALDKLYTLDTFKIFLQTPTSSANIDGFDIWLSENGQEGSYKKVVSVTELFCGQKYETYVEDGMETVMYTAEFEATKAQYMMFGLTQLRCRHEDALKAISADMTPNANPHYFRISEIELWGTPVAGADTTPAETTPAVTTPAETTPAETTPAETTPKTEETTPAPGADTTTAAAPTTTAEEPKKGGCGSSLAIAGVLPIMLCGAAVVIRRRRD